MLDNSASSKPVKEAGQKAPGFTLSDQFGKEVSLKDFKGKVVYMDIWASWCAPCLIQIKRSEEIKKHFEGNQDVVFLYVSIDKNEKNWRNAIEKRNIKGVHLISPEGKKEDILEKYQVPQIPRFVLINKDGEIADFNAKPPSNKAIISDIENLLQ